MASQALPRLSREQYLKIERAAEFRSEYLDGQMVAMAGGSDRHALISANVLGVLWSQLRGKECAARGSDSRVLVPAFNVITYPDVWVGCGQLQHDDEFQDTSLNPRVVIEILSPSTQNYDRSEKFRYYRSISTMQEYLMLAQDKIGAEHYVRQTDGNWLLREFTAQDTSIEVASIGCTLLLTDLYERVFPA